MKRFPMTKEGYDKLEVELNDLKSIQRPNISKAIGEARELGDLKENAEYHAAREQQSFIEARIQNLENKISYAQVVDVTSFVGTDKVLFGATVTLLNISDDKTHTYKLVGEDEADLKENKLSITSPLARELVGKSKEDIIDLDTPKGLVEYEIQKVEFI